MDAFKELGYDVKPIFFNKLGIINNFNKNLLKPFSKDLSEKYLINKIEKEIIQFKPNLILVISPFLIPQSLSNMLSIFENITKIAWIGDRFDEKSNVIANKYDYLYYTDTYFVEEGNTFLFPKGEYLPLAYNKNNFFDKRNLSRTNKLLFIGAMTKQRAAFINSLNNVDLRLVGKRTKKYIDNDIEILDKNISIYDVANEYNKTNYVLNIKQEENVINGLNMRSFEAPASGCCLFQDYLPDIKYNFEPEKDIIVYNNSDELIEYVKKYNKDTFLLKKIIRSGQKNVEANHQYLHRIKKIMLEIN